MKFSSVVVVTVSLLSLLAVAAPARADSYIAPSIGANFGGDAGKSLLDASQDSTKVTYGVAAGTMFNGIFGIEEDFGYSPSFFGHSTGSVRATRVVTLMTNAIIGIPVGGQRGAGVRPFGTIGLGLINRHVESSSLSDFSANDFGFNVGAGVMGYFATHIGLRAGVQYYRNFQRTGDNAIGLNAGEFNFFRGNVGVLFRF